MSPEPQSPLRRPVRVEALRQRLNEITVTADAAERAAVARALDLPSVEELEARYRLSREGERVKLDGSIRARLHQSCVVSLDPFPVVLDVPVSLVFAPQVDLEDAARRGAADEIDVELALESEDPPEPIVDGAIDLGTVTLEFLALALDPYPRKPGAAFAEPSPETAPESPFAALARLKRDG